MKIHYTDCFPETPWYVFEVNGTGYDAAGECTETGDCHGRFSSLKEAQSRFPDATLAKTADTQWGLIPMADVVK